MTNGNIEKHNIQEIKGVGPKLSESLKTLGIKKIEDLLFHLPFRYEDRTKLSSIREALFDFPVLIQGEIIQSSVIYRGKRMLSTEIYDGTGRINVTMFHFAHAQHKALKKGLMMRCYGVIKYGKYGKQMIHPQYQVLDPKKANEIEDSLTPVYALTANLTQPKLRKIIKSAIQYCEENSIFKENRNNQKYGDFLNIFDALKFIHSPPPSADQELLLSKKHPTQLALAEEELVAHVLCSKILKNDVKDKPGPDMAKDSKSIDTLKKLLKFTLTNSQKKAWEQICKDLKKDYPMRRLLQGDVGSGKTVIAALAIFHSYKNNWQSSFLCPTEVLAEQHFNSLSELFFSEGLRVEILTGSTPQKKRLGIINGLIKGEIDLLVGTHAIFQQDVNFHNLGLTIIDEQHRFGVHQRFSMLRKGLIEDINPHQLIMTATPIPRTLAHTVYGSLEVTTIDELPPGRIPVATSARTVKMRNRIIKRIGEICEQGQRAYWVCTLIDESDELEAQSTQELQTEITKELPKVKIGIVHGRMSKKEKDNAIRDFRDGITQLLICTTVIEVGLDVPEATLMIIENPERLGLSQLHQLRGRVGRKANSNSHCLLLHKEEVSDNAKARIEIMLSTNDGFEIAEKDFELRGGGDIFGLRQSGIMDLKIAHPIRNSDLLKKAKLRADEISTTEPEHGGELVKRWVGSKQVYLDS